MYVAHANAPGAPEADAAAKPCPRQACPPQPDCAGVNGGRALSITTRAGAWARAEDKDGDEGEGPGFVSSVEHVDNGGGDGGLPLDTRRQLGSNQPISVRGSSRALAQRTTLEDLTDPFIAPLFGGDLLNFKVYVHELPEEYNEVRRFTVKRLGFRV